MLLINQNKELPVLVSLILLILLHFSISLKEVIFHTFFNTNFLKCILPFYNEMLWWRSASSVSYKQGSSSVTVVV